MKAPHPLVPPLLLAVGDLPPEKSSGVAKRSGALAPRSAARRSYRRLAFALPAALMLFLSLMLVCCNKINDTNQNTNQLDASGNAYQSVNNQTTENTAVGVGGAPAPAPSPDAGGPPGYEPPVGVIPPDPIELAVTWDGVPEGGYDTVPVSTGILFSVRNVTTSPMTFVPSARLMSGLIDMTSFLSEDPITLAAGEVRELTIAIPYSISNSDNRVARDFSSMAIARLQVLCEGNQQVCSALSEAICFHIVDSETASLLIYSTDTLLATFHGGLINPELITEYSDDFNDPNYVTVFGPGTPVEVHPLDWTPPEE